jgi:hypothetical protein
LFTFVYFWCPIDKMDICLLLFTFGVLLTKFTFVYFFFVCLLLVSY